MKVVTTVAVLTLGIAACKKESVQQPTALASASAPTPSVLEGSSLVRLRIDGMSCGGCAQAAQEALEKVDGVRSASVSFEEKIATIQCDPAKVDVAWLISRLENVEMGGKKMPFKVSLIASTSP